MSRASVSIPSNIAEGSARRSDLDFNRFIEMSIGSSFELETQILVAKKINNVNFSRMDELLSKLEELQRMLNSFTSALTKDKKIFK
jgi:four helix bundle protein